MYRLIWWSHKLFPNCTRSLLSILSNLYLGRADTQQIQCHDTISDGPTICPRRDHYLLEFPPRRPYRRTILPHRHTFMFRSRSIHYRRGDNRLRPKVLCHDVSARGMLYGLRRLPRLDQ